MPDFDKNYQFRLFRPTIGLLFVYVDNDEISLNNFFYINQPSRGGNSFNFQQ